MTCTSKYNNNNNSIIIIIIIIIITIIIIVIITIIGVNVRLEVIQKTALLGTAKILRKVLSL